MGLTPRRFPAPEALVRMAMMRRISALDAPGRARNPVALRYGTTTVVLSF